VSAKFANLLKGRTLWLLLIFAFMYLAIAVQLFRIQVLDRARYLELADKRERRFTNVGERGTIYDRTGSVLATNIPAYSVCAYPKCFETIQDRERAVNELSKMLGLTKSDIEKRLSRSDTFVYIKRHIPYELGEKIAAAKLIGIGLERETRRYYPGYKLAAQVIGFTEQDGIVGVEGIESAQNESLGGREGEIIAQVDAKGRVIPETRRIKKRAEPGNDVFLTIDRNLQHIAEKALEKSFKTYNAAGAVAIVMDPHTGEILALANCPRFDPNDRNGTNDSYWRNRAVRDVYEPGSTLKMVTVAAAVEEGVSPRQPVAVCTKSGLPIGRRRIRCSLHRPYLAGHGSVDMYSIIQNSCNIGAASIAMHKLGAEKMYEYLGKFGLLNKPGSGLPGEQILPLEQPDSWPTIKLANVGFGQGVAVTPLQMASAYSVIANGGVLMQPHIVKEIRSPDGLVIKSFQPKAIRRVVSSQTAAVVTDMLVGCVEEGTGKTSKIEGYSVAGKTGSAEKAVPGQGFNTGKYVASFMGFVPAKNPRLVICVVVDEPKGSHWGATCAAPVFKEIAEKAMVYLRVPPDEPAKVKPPAGGGSVNVEKVKHSSGAYRTG